MEVSFMPGLDLGQQLYDKKRDKQSRLAETVWQAYERRRKCAWAPLPLQWGAVLKYM